MCPHDDLSLLGWQAVERLLQAAEVLLQADLLARRAEYSQHRVLGIELIAANRCGATSRGVPILDPVAQLEHCGVVEPLAELGVAVMVQPCVVQLLQDLAANRLHEVYAVFSGCQHSPHAVMQETPQAGQVLFQLLAQVGSVAAAGGLGRCGFTRT